MINIKRVGQYDGELITYYRGKNVALIRNDGKYTRQQILLIKQIKINGGITLGYCSIFKLLDRKFLFHFNGNEVYEIIKQDSNEVYIHLSNSWYGIAENFLEDNIYVNYLHFHLYCEYSPIATYSEFFELQFNFGLHNHVLEWYRKVQQEQNNN